MAFESHLPDIGDLIDRGKYRIDRRIGEGGMGVVFAATHLQLGKPRAIKWLLPEFSQDALAVQRFLAEAHIAAKIEHPNVVSPIDVSQDDGAPFIVMELLDGETLEPQLAGRSLALAEAARILLPVLDGVAAAHDRSVVHRDIKPGNVFLARSAAGSTTPKVLDFGIAKIMDSSRSLAALTENGELLGTIQYMSPEQLEDPSRVGRQTDVYALGVLLYRMLAGRLPYTGNLLDIALRIREGNATPLRAVVPDLPAAIDAIVQRAIAPSLAQRYTDVRSFAAAIAALPECAAVVRERPRPRVRWSQRRSFPRVQDLPELAAVASSRPPAQDVSSLHPVTTRAVAGAARTKKRVLIAASIAVTGGLAAIAWPGTNGVEQPERAARASVPAVPLHAPDAARPLAEPRDAGSATEPVPGWQDLGTVPAR